MLIQVRPCVAGGKVEGKFVRLSVGREKKMFCLDPPFLPNSMENKSFERMICHYYFPADKKQFRFNASKA